MRSATLRYLDAASNLQKICLARDSDPTTEEYRNIIPYVYKALKETTYVWERTQEEIFSRNKDTVPEPPQHFYKKYPSKVDKAFQLYNIWLQMPEGTNIFSVFGALNGALLDMVKENMEMRRALKWTGVSEELDK